SASSSIPVRATSWARTTSIPGFLRNNARRMSLLKFWLANENFNNDILRALFRRKPGIDVVRAQDVALTGIDDEALLAWAAEEDRVLLRSEEHTFELQS